MKLKNPLYTIIILLSCALGLFAKEDDPQKILDKVQNKYEKNHNLCIDFVQTFVWEMANEEQMVEGKIKVQDGTKFLIETPDQRLVCDGKTLWTFNFVNKQVMVDNASKQSQKIPFIQEYLSVYKENYNAKLMSNKDDYIIELTSKNQDQYIVKIILDVDDNFIVKNIEQIDTNNNKTIYKINDVSFDCVLQANDFKPSVEGFELVDLR